MKKILLSLFLIVTSMQVSKLSAYCVYNHSNDETIVIYVYPSKDASKKAALFKRKAKHELPPKYGKRCWNWKEISKNRKKEWYWVAYKGRGQWYNMRTMWTDKLGEGYFPIGGAVSFRGYDEDAKAIFKIFYDKKSWEYKKSPWNHKSKPWKTYKR